MAGPGVELLFGPMLIGVLLSTACYGVMAVQMFTYYQTFKKDNPWIRYFVLYLLFAETANLLFEIGIIYEPLIVRYGSQRALIVSPLFLPGDAISIVMVSTPIQFFTAWRISVITGSMVLSIFICLFAIASFGGGFLVTFFVSTHNEFQDFKSFSGVIIVWLVSSAVCDVLIAIILTYSLRTRKTGFTAVDGQINRIIRLTVQTGSITAVAALADVLLFLAFPGTSLNFIPDFPLSKLYSICLISTLNARKRGKVQDVEQRLPNALFKESGTGTAALGGFDIHPATTVNMLQSPLSSHGQMPGKVYNNTPQMHSFVSSSHTLVPPPRRSESERSFVGGPGQRPRSASLPRPPHPRKPNMI